MTPKFALKAVCAALALAAGGTAYAGPFYIDIGTDYDAIGTNQVTPTSTSMKNEFTYAYQSNTTVYDTDSNGIDAGDGVVTSGGLAVGGFNLAGLTNNKFTDLLPSQILGLNSNNGLNTNYFLSFSVTGLAGVVTGMTAGVPSLGYGPGLIEMFLTFDGVNYNNFMDVNVTGGVTTTGGTILLGVASFANVDAGYNNLFHSGEFTCGGSSGFFDIYTNCGLSTKIDFLGDFNTNIAISDISDVIPGTPPTYLIASNHDGSGTFNVPEPGSLALLGLALAGLGLTQRRRKLEK